MRPHVICHMITSLDGGLHPSRFTASPQGGRADWATTYERIHEELKGDAWMVGRVTMAEMSKAAPHPPNTFGAVERPARWAVRGARSYAIAFDPGGKLHFAKPDVGGDPVIVALGRDAPDSHLSELAADGVSYVISEAPTIDLLPFLETLGAELGLRRLLLEGGGAINGAFFAAGLVDELSLLVAPAIEGRVGAQRFVEFGETGLAGKAQLALLDCRTLEHGLLHLRYQVTR